MNRFRLESEIEALEMADSLISLSNSNHSAAPEIRPRVFVCKTCNREFSSFQALGGHRASHRKLKLLSPSSGDVFHNNQIKTKVHECSICGVEFPIGQALGGHMRRHRNSSPPVDDRPPMAAQPVSNEYNCDVGVGGGVGLDLNLTPLENDLVRLQLMAPPVDCLT